MAAGDGIVVVKVGGAAVAAAGGLPPALADVAALVRAGSAVVVVHGGGPEITHWSKRLGQTPRFVDGRRYSDDETVGVAEMALARVGKAIAAGLTAAGADAVSMGGRDAALLTARVLRPSDGAGQPIDLGRVGEVTGVRVEVLHRLLAAGLVPVLSTVAGDGDGGALNVNADDAAAAVAAALGASCLVLATDVPGILLPDQDLPLGHATAAQAAALIAGGVVTGGMRPKVEACLQATAGGAATAWIVDGRRPGTVVAAANGQSGAGTAIGAAPTGAVPLPDAAALDRDFVMQTYPRPTLSLVHGRGATVWDTAGRAYLDFLCGISVTNLGHCHPRVTEAITTQAARLGHTSNLYLTRPPAELAHALIQASFPGHVFFCNSGAEATEGALKLCRKAAWRKAQGTGQPPATQVISFDHAFHGRTYGALAVTPGYQTGFGPMLEGFTVLPWDDLAAVEAAIGPQTAGVIVEPVQGEGGVRPASAAFLAGLRALCDRYGAALIFDEIQCGLGRTGKMFAFEHYGVRPDVMTLGKALGAGLPMGAFVAAPGWDEALRPGDHASTFGGNPIVAAAGLAGLRALREDGLIERSAALGERLRSLLHAAFDGSPAVTAIRGLGLMTGMVLADPTVGPKVVAACRERGLLINCTAQTVLRLMPPLVISEAEIERAVGILAQCLPQAQAVAAG